MKKKENIDIFKNFNIKNLSENSLESLEEIVKFIPENTDLRREIIKEILRKKRNEDK